MFVCVFVCVCVCVGVGGNFVWALMATYIGTLFRFERLNGSKRSRMKDHSVTSCGLTLRTLRPGTSAHAELGGCLDARYGHNAPQTVLVAACSRQISAGDQFSWCLNDMLLALLLFPQVTSEFNHINGLELICRAHQLVQEGLKYMFPEKSLVTVSPPPPPPFQVTVIEDRHTGTPSPGTHSPHMSCNWFVKAGSVADNAAAQTSNYL